MKFAISFSATVIAAVALTAHITDATELQARDGAALCQVNTHNCQDKGTNVVPMDKDVQFYGCNSILIQGAKQLCSGCRPSPGTCRDVHNGQCVDMYNGKVRLPYDCLA